MKKNNIIIGILMLIALGGALFLVNKNQEMRKGAAFANTILKLLPSEKIVANVNESFSVHLHYITEGGAKLYNIDTVICYDPRLELLVSESRGNVDLGYGDLIINNANDEIEGDLTRTSVGVKCSRVIALKNISSLNLAETSGEIAVLKFKSSMIGSGKINIDKERSKATGENPNSETDKWITVTEVENTSYEITGSSSETCETDADCPPGYECIQPPMLTCPKGQNCLDVLPKKICVPIDACKTVNNRPIDCACTSNAQCASLYCNMTTKKCAEKPIVTPTIDVCAVVNNRPIDCACTSNAQCASLYCNMTTKKCAEKPIVTPTIDVCAVVNNRPIDCACTSNAQCASLYCNMTTKKCAEKPIVTPTIDVCAVVNNRPIDCACTSNAQCASLYCNMTTKKCAEKPIVTPTIDVCAVVNNRPIDCACTSNAQCASLYCNMTTKKCAEKPIVTPTMGEISDWPVLNYKVQYAFVKSDYSQCFVPSDWPLQITVLSGGVTKTYNGVVPGKINKSEVFVTAEGSLVLEGFDKTSNVAVFIKGPKHLQMKYAVDKQEGRYNKAGGELTLTKFVETSPVYDFTAYPILPGDIRGENSDNPDGVVNGYDWTEVKRSVKILETVEEGSYLKADLDGSCQVNSNDLYILRLTLEEKQGELY